MYFDHKTSVLAPPLAQPPSGAAPPNQRYLYGAGAAGNPFAAPPAFGFVNGANPGPAPLVPPDIPPPDVAIVPPAPLVPPEILPPDLAIVPPLPPLPGQQQGGVNLGHVIPPPPPPRRNRPRPPRRNPQPPPILKKNPAPPPAWPGAPPPTFWMPPIFMPGIDGGFDGGNLGPGVSGGGGDGAPPGDPGLGGGAALPPGQPNLGAGNPYTGGYGISPPPGAPGAAGAPGAPGASNPFYGYPGGGDPSYQPATTLPGASGSPPPPSAGYPPYYPPGSSPTYPSSGGYQSSPGGPFIDGSSGDLGTAANSGDGMYPYATTAYPPAPAAGYVDQTSPASSGATAGSTMSSPAGAGTAGQEWPYGWSPYGEIPTDGGQYPGSYQGAASWPSVFGDGSPDAPPGTTPPSPNSGPQVPLPAPPSLSGSSGPGAAPSLPQPGAPSAINAFPYAQPYNVFTPRQTAEQANLAVADAQRAANPYALAVQTMRPGTGLSAGNYAEVMPQVAQDLSQGALARQQIPFQNALANQSNLLSGQILRNQGYNQLSSIGQNLQSLYNSALSQDYGMGLNNAQYGLGQQISQQTLLAQLAAGLLS